MNPLSVVVKDAIWSAQQPLKFGPLRLRTRMTVVRQADGTLWVHSPVLPTDHIMAQLSVLGEVSHVVAPNCFHHLYFAEFLKQFPAATGWIAPGLARKRPDLAHHRVTSPGQPRCGDIAGCFIEGLPTLNETVWFHQPSRTLIVADLLFRFGTDNPAMTRVAGRLLGVQGTVAMSRTMRWMVKDRTALRRSVDKVLAWEPERIVLAHDQVVDRGARKALAAAFAWLG